MQIVTLEDYANSFGTTVDTFSKECLKLIEKRPLPYQIIEGKEKEALILEILKRLVRDSQKIGTKERTDIWEHGWKENLEAFKVSRDEKDLIPKFIRPKQPIRFQGNYILPGIDNFELDYFEVFRLWLFQKYFSDYSSIYDFGCGSSFNLVKLAQLYPTKDLIGLDFVPSSVELARELGSTLRIPITAHQFDITTPNYKVELDSGSIVFTAGVIEQVASIYEPFLQYLLFYNPGLCVHIEPTIELYDENNLTDYLAIMFHKKRGYTEGFLPRLQELQAQGRIEILKTKRLHFGSLMMEGFNLIVWRPL